MASLELGITAAVSGTDTLALVEHRIIILDMTMTGVTLKSVTVCVVWMVETYYFLGVEAHVVTN